MKLMRAKPPEPPQVPSWRLRSAPELQRATAELNEARTALIAADRWLHELEHRKEKADDYRERLEAGQVSTVEPGKEIGPADEEFVTAREAVRLRTERLDRALAALERARELPKVDAVAAAKRAGTPYITKKRLTYQGEQFVVGQPINLSGLSPDKRRQWIDNRIVEEVG